MFKKIKTVGVNKLLAQKYGGKWTYCRKSGQWNRDDGSAYVCNVLTGRDFDGEYTGKTTKCMYFRDSRSPEWIYF